ncbi:MAG: UvrB/UvrC motif-containing protein, partial [Phascolarctobacterium sp.]|nr:UvrB/UvrC motif-containing protein [Phascolarctobacterium sp.]
DRVTESMQRAIDETNRRRQIQKKYNEEHGIVPKTIYKEKRALIQLTKVADGEKVYNEKKLEKANKKELQRLARELESAMRDAAKRLDFEQAAELRDRLIVVRGKIRG